MMLWGDVKTIVSGMSSLTLRATSLNASAVFCIFFSSPLPIPGRMIGGCGSINAPIIGMISLL
jgi:hypothetical protein